MLFSDPGGETGLMCFPSFVNPTTGDMKLTEPFVHVAWRTVGQDFMIGCDCGDRESQAVWRYVEMSSYDVSSHSSLEQFYIDIGVESDPCDHREIARKLLEHDYWSSYTQDSTVELRPVEVLTGLPGLFASVEDPGDSRLLARSVFILSRCHPHDAHLFNALNFRFVFS
jgi:hypothetical protein